MRDWGTVAGTDGVTDTTLVGGGGSTGVGPQAIANAANHAAAIARTNGVRIGTSNCRRAGAELRLFILIKPQNHSKNQACPVASLLCFGVFHSGYRGDILIFP